MRRTEYTPESTATGADSISAPDRPEYSMSNSGQLKLVRGMLGVFHALRQRPIRLCSGTSACRARWLQRPRNITACNAWLLVRVSTEYERVT